MQCAYVARRRFRLTQGFASPGELLPAGTDPQTCEKLARIGHVQRIVLITPSDMAAVSEAFAVFETDVRLSPEHEAILTGKAVPESAGSGEEVSEPDRKPSNSEGAGHSPEPGTLHAGDPASEAAPPKAAKKKGGKGKGGKKKRATKKKANRSKVKAGQQPAEPAGEAGASDAGSAGEPRREAALA